MSSKFSRPIVAAFALFTTAALAATVTVAEINAKVAGLLAQANDANTKIEASFSQLAVDSVRATQFGAALHAEEIGTRLVKFDAEGDYEYVTLATGDEPRFSAKVALEMDFVGAFGQEVVNEIAGDIESMAMNIVKDFTAEYGAAAQAQIAIENLQRDPQGNIVAARIKFDGVVDFSQLPATKPLRDVELKEIHAVIDVNFQGQQGARLEVSGIMNPAYRSFQADQTGLKELIEGLLADDMEAYQTITQILGFAAAGMEWLSNTKP
jgi:hypothetical protein